MSNTSVPTTRPLGPVGQMLWLVGATAGCLLSCGTETPEQPPAGSGGTAPATGGSPSRGGAPSGGGIAATGGSLATGGVFTGGAPATGGTATGGKSTGGSSTGGTSTGGKATGGTSTGGVATGGKATGGTSTGGTSTGGSGTGGTGTCTGHTGFWVDGRYLRDRCCEKVILRGVNEMVIWSSSQDGTPYFAEIAKTGANVVRIAWATTGSPSKLDAAIKNAIANQLIPIPELHDATGDFSKLSTCLDYWVRSDVVSVIQKYQDKVLVNIANEVGDGSVTQSTFTTAYQGAITRLRNAGIHVPLVIDGSSWGQDINMLQAAGPGLITFDPDHNIVLSVHMWWNDPNGTRVTTELNESVSKNLPVIVGEFAQHAVSGCSGSPFAYKTLLSLSRTLEIGWMAWSWGGVKNGDCASDGPFDMTTNGTYNGLTGWGLEVARTDPNSIQNTAVRPHYVTAGSCN